LRYSNWLKITQISSCRIQIFSEKNMTSEVKISLARVVIVGFKKWSLIFN
jgi:hypothetical protein